MVQQRKQTKLSWLQDPSNMHDLADMMTEMDFFCASEWKTKHGGTILNPKQRDNQWSGITRIL
jgi:hypothetical protein